MAGCSDDSPTSAPAAAETAGPTPSAPENESSAGYVLGSRIRDPSGRTFYVTVLPDLEPRRVDLSRSLELSGFARSFAFDGSVFTMDSETLEVARYRVTADLGLELEGRLSMANQGFSSFSTLFAFIEPQVAFYVDPQQLQVVRWNPEAMVIDEVIPIEGISRQDYATEMVGMLRSGDRLYLPVGWTKELEFDALPSVGALILDATTGATIDVLEDDRCAVGGGGLVSSEGDVYVLGDAGGGTYSVFGDVETPPCLLRISAGERRFDPDYYVDLSEVAGAPVVGRMVGLPDGTAVTRRVIEGVDPRAAEDPFQLTLQEIWEWVVIDVDAETSAPLGIPPSALTFPPFVVGGEIAVIRESEDGTSTLFVVERNGNDGLEDVTARESITVQGEILQLGRLEVPPGQ